MTVLVASSGERKRSASQASARGRNESATLPNLLRLRPRSSAAGSHRAQILQALHGPPGPERPLGAPAAERPGLHSEALKKTPAPPPQVAGLPAVLFLDVDGVLHPVQARHPRQQFVNGCLALVADVVKATGAAICLSTAWRLDPQARKFVEGKLRDFGLGPPVGRTPNLAQFHRSREILAWVQKFKPATWVALDDWPLIEEEPKMQGHFVQSRPRYGLQPDTAQKVVELFKLQQQHIKCQPLARG
mmetsp:Transcript_45254/g.105900  ORF Transcript_45254/g.105900 Transcript_45254/m.105900 type:complete len:246 (-) Transcript_45254:50-787(-)